MNAHLIYLAAREESFSWIYDGLRQAMGLDGIKEFAEFVLKIDPTQRRIEEMINKHREADHQ
ncbi:MAG: hypothetical protein WC455_29590 [Dehalococcoidia bacterium]|jgi:hypothetical protein